ncbi:YqaE/Pmp3 family membrane protein [Rhodobacteraceae bacterium S2214]|nr:YqaE/Pmp3 family membrane protein [Rhodobacteraceae bacterium S2214]
MYYWLKLLAVIIIPPLGVFLTVGFRGAFWLNILLTCLFYVPGFIHAAYILARSLPARQA